MLWRNSQLVCARQTSQTHYLSTVSTRTSLGQWATWPTSRAKSRIYIRLRSSQWRLKRSYPISKWAITRRAACQPRAATIWATLPTQTATRLETSSSCPLSKGAEATWTWWICSIWITASITTLARSARRRTAWKQKTSSLAARKRTHQLLIRANTWHIRRRHPKHSSKVSKSSQGPPVSAAAVAVARIYFKCIIIGTMLMTFFLHFL